MYFVFFQKTITEKGLNDGFDGAIIRLDLKNSSAIVTSANFSVLYLKNGKVERLNHDKFGIGSNFYNDKNFSDHTFNKNTELFLFSDGITTQFGSNQNDLRKTKLGLKPILSILETHHTLSNKEKSEKIISFLKEWQGELTQTDDQILISLKL